MKINVVTIQDAYIFSSTKKFTTEFTEMKIKFIINFYSEYNQVILHSKS